MRDAPAMRRLLVPTDFSAHATAAVRYASLLDAPRREATTEALTRHAPGPLLTVSSGAVLIAAAQRPVYTKEVA